MRSEKELQEINQACLSEIVRHDEDKAIYQGLIQSVIKDKLAKAILGRIQDLYVSDLLFLAKLQLKPQLQIEKPAQITSKKK